MNLFQDIEPQEVLELKASMYSDGGSRGNPGPSGAGYVLYDKQNQEIDRGGMYCGETTNNVAEYQSLICGLTRANELNVSEIEAHMDSLLVVQQMRGNYRVKNAGLKPLFEKAKALSENFQKITYTHIPREKNSVADAIANAYMDNPDK